VIGLDQKEIAGCFEKDLELDEIYNHLSQLKPQFLSKFPPGNKKGLKIDESVE
jgi:hypothetical protein